LLRWLRSGRPDVLLPISLGLLAFAHSVIALFGIVAVAVAAVGAFTPWELRKNARVLALLAGYAVALLLLAAPFLWAHLHLSRYYDVSNIVAGWYEVEGQFRRLSAYLFDRWIWGRDWTRVQLRVSPLTIVFGCAAFSAAVLRLWRREGGEWTRTLAFLVGGLVVSVALLCRPAAFLYAWMALLLIAWHLASLQCRGMAARAGWLAVAFFALSLLTSTSLHPIRYDWFPPEALASRPAPGEATGVAAVGEYMPRIEASGVEEDATYASDRYRDALRSFAERGVELLTAGAASGAVCRVEPSFARRPEQRSFRYRTDCGAPAVLVVPQNYSGLERVTRTSTESGDPIALAAFRIATDPRIRVRLPPGRHEVVADLPRLSHLIRSGP
jgi:hypothetical protein